MGRDLYDALPAARGLYERANAALGFDLAKLCFDGPEDELSDTAACQPGVLVTSLAALEALKAKDADAAKADFAAGLSLGEYTALVFAGAIAFEDAVRLVRDRGLFMKEAAETSPGAMASVLGMSREDVMAVVASSCQEKGTLVAANFNSPGQTVLSGTPEAIDCAADLAKERGAKRVVKLAVTVASHSPLMEPAVERLKEALDRAEFRAPQVPVVSNVSARAVGSADEVRDLLSLQLTSPVLWEDSMRFLIGEGMTEAVEVGPGRVLSGLLARIDNGVATRNVGSLADLE